MKNILAIIVPCFNEEEVLQETCSQLSNVLKSIVEKQKISSDSYICFVDDGSSDKTWQIISTFSKSKNVTGLKLSKNFGHQAALLAGLTKNDADMYITIDADLQDDINVIEKMVDNYHNGCEIVYGVRNDRKSDSFMKRTAAEFYYKTTAFLGVNTIFNHADFRLMSNKVVKILKELKESNLYLRGLIPSLGFNSCCVYYTRQKRCAGKTKYSCYRLFALAIDGITSFSVTPLRFITALGFICFLVAIVMSIFATINYFETRNVPGWASLFVSLYFLGGIQLLSIGIIGEYIGKIYKETKQRPTFVVEDKTCDK